MMRRPQVLIAVLSLLCTPAARGYAQSDDAGGAYRSEVQQEVAGDPHLGAATWLRPAPAIQVEQDPQLRPAASGGIFVPSMTDSTAEPAYFVFDQDWGLVDEAPAGRVLYVAPGTYTVLVGSGVREEMLEFEATVVEGRVTFIPVEWSGLVVTVVDARGTPFRGSYELVRMPSREYVGLGLGASLSEGESLETWLLWPGQYMILAAGESYQARKNFATLRLLPGELVQYTIVLDAQTGDLMGAGEVTLAPETTEGWDVNVVLGGSVNFNQSDNVIGKAEGQSLDLAAFIETVGAFLSEQNFVYGRLNLELGGRIQITSGPDDEAFQRPFITSVDDVNLDLLYAYRLTPWFGPYARSSLETNMLPAYQVFDEPTTVRRVRLDGAQTFEPDALEVKLAEPLSPLELEAGSGGRLDLSAGFWMKLNLRLGLGLRQVFNRSTFVVDDLSVTPEFDVAEIEHLTQFGAEGAVVLELSPSRWITLKADANTLVPFNAIDRTLIGFRGTVTVRLTSVASINYTLRVKDDPELLDKTQVDQSVLLRLAYQLL